MPSQNGSRERHFQETRDAWLLADPPIPHELQASPDNLWMMTVDGGSMETMLSSGDGLLIELIRQVPVPPGIFVIWNGMGLVSKRIEHVSRSAPPRGVVQASVRSSPIAGRMPSPSRSRWDGFLTSTVKT